MDQVEFDKLYVERLDEHVMDFIKASRLHYEYENKPMTLKERGRYEHAIHHYWDVFMFDREVFKNFLGEAISNAYSNAFENLFNGGKQQACYENAQRMKVKGYPLEDIVEITDLTAEEIEAL